MTDTTSLTLLQRLKDKQDEDAWAELSEVYEPLLTRWVRMHEIQDADADDLVQEVLVAINRHSVSFEHNGHAGAFRKWLRVTLHNRIRAYWKAKGKLPKPMSNTADSLEANGLLDRLADPHSEISQQWDAEHDRYVLEQLLRIVRKEFQSTTWTAFFKTSVEGVDAKEVAESLGITLNAVMIAKSRVLQRLRVRAQGLVDSALEIRM